MQITPNCTCYEGETKPTFWTEVPAMVKPVVDESGNVLSSEISDLDPTWEDQVYYCSWCGEEATVILPKIQYFSLPNWPDGEYDLHYQHVSIKTVNNEKIISVVDKTSGIVSGG